MNFIDDTHTMYISGQDDVSHVRMVALPFCPFISYFPCMNFIGESLCDQSCLNFALVQEGFLKCLFNGVVLTT